MRIAVDLLGGDHAPQEILKGVALALQKDFSAAELLLVGPKEVAEKFFATEGIHTIPEIIHTDVFIGAEEKPVEGLRTKPTASISLAVGAVHEGHAEGLVAMGNTGATVAGATMGMGMLEGIRRPGIAVQLRGDKGSFLLLDAGANPAPKAKHLFHYGLMGEAFARDIFNIPKPRLALLNIGGEASKGSPLLKEAHGLLANSDCEFIGNIEGNEIFFGKADVVVADGFAGNMVLKVVEGFAEFLSHRAQKLGESNQEISNSLTKILGASEFSDVGGAILLGVKGTVIIGHGRSRANAVLSALQGAREEIRKDVNQHIQENISAHSKEPSVDPS